MGLSIYGNTITSMAGEGGFEPPLYGPEPHVLPLDDSPMRGIIMLPEIL